MDPIEIRNVEKTYGDVRALDGVTLTLRPGTVHGLVGPNGSGKTTLLRILLGLTRPTAGTVSMPDASIGCGFQEPRFYDELTVEENLEVFAALAGSDAAGIETVIEGCGLEPVVARTAGDLSDGFAKRLDLALALLDRPEVVLLDEPFADVDDEAKPRLLSLLESYAGEDRLLVVTTHQLSAFEELLDALTVIHRGEVVLDERLAEEDRDLTATYLDRLEAARDAV